MVPASLKGARRREHEADDKRHSTLCRLIVASSYSLEISKRVEEVEEVEVEVEEATESDVTESD
ncbi:hypothetical protein MGYG_08051 [Nannizzia gypsea CBS 118893]|uniref:Uncharacterized protein n=1 Tax=Arthroderma gypseum (strain ATCC MYA-4604 / CBS 118893) TaxID=535722 RepID=E4V4X1_ARTGP|nr:hypothetical protein MGYG_08051 [Nannizzia gypsea CBS 118893]EFR05045.1 hypothetical protein MGYG_08051 [Nannizzia gypsea CBS 118893]